MGSFFIVTENGERFDVPIATLVLEAGADDMPARACCTERVPLAR